MSKESFFSRQKRLGSISIGGSNFPNYFLGNTEEEDPRLARRASSVHGFLAEKNLHPLDSVEDVETDVLFPSFKANQEAIVDIDTFHRMVQDRVRQMSQGSLSLSKSFSKQNQLYGPIKHDDFSQHGVRFIVYSCQKNVNIFTGLNDLLTEEGQVALESVISLRGWWLDVLCPSVEEMHILSKTFNIHPLTTEDIQAQEPREKVEIFPNYTFVSFKSIDIDQDTERVVPYNFYSLIFRDGFLTFHFKDSEHGDAVRKRCDQLKEYMLITPDWMNYALIDSITDNLAPIITEVEMEAVSLDELSLVLSKNEQSDMLKRISRCRKKSTQLARLLGSKLDVIKSLMKRYEDKLRELDMPNSRMASFTTKPNTDTLMLDTKKSFSDVLLYLGDIQDHIVTMVQNINHYDRILHRSHTNYLAQINLELTETYNKTNGVMNRLTFMATVFIPLTLVCSLWGMNVNVPGQVYHDSVYFTCILSGMAIYCIGCVFFGKRVGLL